MTPNSAFKFRIQLIGIFLATMCLPGAVYAQTGGCPTGVLATGNQSITCSTTATSSAPVSSSTAISTYSTSSPPPSGSPSLTSTAYDGVSALVTRYTTVQLSGSPIGLASGSSATNYGTLSSNSFTYGYGISFGANGRTTTGGNTVLNGSTGQILTAGGNANGIYIATTSATARGNSITNDGSVTTSGSSAAGISLLSGSNNATIANAILNTGVLTTSGLGSYGVEFSSSAGTNTINNSGSISTSGNLAHGMSISSTRNTVGIVNTGTISVGGTNANAINVAGAANISNSGTISSASGLAINFGGTLPTNAFNSLTINAGSVINGGITFNAASTKETLTFNGYTNSGFNNAITGLNIINANNGSNIVMTSSTGYDLVSGQIAVDATSALNISGVVRDQVSPALASILTKTGAGVLTLSGSNTFTGGANLNAGTIAVGNNAALGAGNLVMADGTTLQAAVNNIALANNISVAGVSTVDTNGNNLSLSGNVAATGGVTKIGAGTLTLSGASNSYSGGTNVNAGTLKSSVSGAFSSNSAFVVSAGATLDLNGYSQTIGSLAGTGNTSLGSGNLTTGGNNTSTSYSGSIDGSGSINKVGAGTFSLTGASSYSGGTNLNAGTIAVGNYLALGTGSLAMANGTTLQAASAVALTNAITTAGNSTVDTNGNGFGLSGAITGAGSLTKIGAGILTLSGANTYSGGTTVSAGTLAGNSTSLQGNITNNATVDFNQTTAGTYTGVMSGTGNLVKEGAGTLTVSGSNTYSGGTTVSAGTLAGNTNSIQGNIMNNGTVQFTQAAAGAYAGIMSGTGNLVKEGASTLTLSGANAYSGGTSLNAGTIAVGNNAALGGNGLAMAAGTTLQAASVVSLANAVSTSGTVTIDTNGNNLGLSGVISGAGAVTKVGASTLTLSGANTYSGGTSLNAGTIAVGNNAALGAGSLAMSNGTTLQAASSVSLSNNVSTTGAANIDTNGNNLGLSGVISGASDVNKNGAGALMLSGINTYSGDTNINAGSVILTGSITSDTNIAAGGTLQGNGVVNGNINNAGSIIPSFTGNQTNLTVNGNYVGAGGNFVSNVYAPVTNPVADKLVVSGTASGATGVTIIDRGGLGNRTSGAGIEVVSVGGTSTATAFALNQRVASGAFEYKLVKGDASGAGNSWYLRTDNPQVPATPNEPPAALATPAVGERIEVSVYPALPSLVQLYAQTAVDTLDQRRGDLNLVDPQGSTKKAADGWARIIGKTGAATPSNVNDGPKLNFNTYALQFGADLYKDESGSRTYIGPYVTVGGANGNTSNQAGTISTGSISGMQAYSFGLYATHFAQNGLYVDALAQGSKYLNANASSVQGAQLKTQGSGLTGSLETGGRWNVTEKMLISPQAQVVYDAIGMNNASDAYGQVNFTKSEMSRGRLGLLFGQKDVVSGTPIFAYIRASYWNVFNPGTTTSFQSLYGVNAVSFQSQTASRWMTVDAEINARLTKDTNLFFNIALDNSLVGTYQAYSGRLGLQTRF